MVVTVTRKIDHRWLDRVRCASFRAGWRNPSPIPMGCSPTRVLFTSVQRIHQGPPQETRWIPFVLPIHAGRAIPGYIIWASVSPMLLRISDFPFPVVEEQQMHLGISTPTSMSPFLKAATFA